MKNKKLAAILTLVCFLFTLMPVAAMAEDGVPALPNPTEGWKASSDGTYIIANAADLVAFANAANNGQKFSGKTVKLTATIDLGGATWTPIKNFLGTFDGGTNTIKNFHLDATEDHAGFFYKIDYGNGTAIKNLTLADITATVGNYYVGALAYFSFAVQDDITIKNFTVTTTASDAHIGGYAGFVEWGHIRNCTIENMTVDATNGVGHVGGLAAVLKADSWLQYNNIDVKGFKVDVHDTDKIYAEIGGLVGQTQTGHDAPVFTNCDISGIDVTASGAVTVGGFIARPGAHTTAQKCTTEGKIDVTQVTDQNESAGGFFGNLGWNNNESSRGGHKLTDCSANVDIITKIAPAGGFIGSATNEQDYNMAINITNCNAYGDITATEGATANIGAFAGEADRGTYTNCSASGDVVNNGTGTAGQFIGEVEKRHAMAFTDCNYTGESETTFIGDQEDDAVVTIVNNVAQIGETKYPTLALAIEAANNSEEAVTIILLKDAEVSGVEIAKNKDVTIDLNGNELALKAGTGWPLAPAITVNGMLTIVGDGDVPVTGEGFVTGIKVAESAALIINGGNYGFFGTQGEIAMVYGSIEINDGVFSTQGTASMIGTDTTAIVKIKGGKFDTVPIDDDAKSISILGGVFAEPLPQEILANVTPKVGAVLNSEDGYSYFESVEKAKVAGSYGDTVMPIATDGTVEEDKAIVIPRPTSSSSGGGFSGAYNHPVNVSATGADVTLSDNYAVKGETVTITIDPDMGKKVDEVIVTDKDGNVISVTKVGDNKYTFTMPEGKVNVAVTTEDADYDQRIVMQINNKNIVVNNRTITNDVSPVIVGDRTLVPVRIVIELLGGTADWDEATRTVTLTIDGKVLKLVIDEEIPGYGTGATIINNRTYVPIRWIIENLDGHVTWIEATQQIIIEK